MAWQTSQECFQLLEFPHHNKEFISFFFFNSKHPKTYQNYKSNFVLPPAPLPGEKFISNPEPRPELGPERKKTDPINQPKKKHGCHRCFPKRLPSRRVAPKWLVSLSQKQKEKKRRKRFVVSTTFWCIYTYIPCFWWGRTFGNSNI